MRCFGVDNCCFGSLIGTYRCAVAAGREKSPRLLCKSPLLFAETRQLLRTGSRVFAVRGQAGGEGSGKKGNKRARYACLRVEKMSRRPIIRPLCLPYRAEVLILHPNGTSVPFPPSSRTRYPPIWKKEKVSSRLSIATCSRAPANSNLVRISWNASLRSSLKWAASPVCRPTVAPLNKSTCWPARIPTRPYALLRKPSTKWALKPTCSTAV